MTAQAVRAARPGLTPGSQVTATYTLRQRCGRGVLRFDRAVTGTLERVRWITPTVFEATINVGGLDWRIDNEPIDGVGFADPGGRELAELVEALDGWLSQGGFLPAVWADVRGPG